MPILGKVPPTADRILVSRGESPFPCYTLLTGYDWAIDYRLSPVPPLSEAYAAWAGLLRNKGLR